MGHAHGVKWGEATGRSPQDTQLGVDVGLFPSLLCQSVGEVDQQGL